MNTYKLTLRTIFLRKRFFILLQILSLIGVFSDNSDLLTINIIQLVPNHIKVINTENQFNIHTNNYCYVTTEFQILPVFIHYMRLCQSFS